MGMTRISGTYEQKINVNADSNSERFHLLEMTIVSEGEFTGVVE